MNSPKIASRILQENKLNAERLIIKNLVFWDTKEYLDTVTLTQTFVKDPIDFFKIFAEATSDYAFWMPWQIVNTPELKLGKLSLA